MMTLYSNLPTLDLHGIDREYAKILINDFIYDKIVVTREMENIDISYTEDNITSIISVPIKVIENTDSKEEIKEEVANNIIVKTQRISNPKTSDSINLYFQLFIISILGFICSIYYKRVLL